MSNILYNPPAIKSKRNLSFGQKEEIYHLPQGIEKIASAGKLIYFCKGYEFHAFNFSDAPDPERISLKIYDPISLTSAGLLSFDRLNNKYCFHKLTKDGARWLQKTIYLEHIKTSPLFAHITHDGIYLLDQKYNLYINKAPLTEDTSWHKLETGLEIIKGASCDDGIFLWSGEDALWIKAGAWSKTKKCFPDNIKKTLLFENELLFLTENGSVKNKAGETLFRSIIDAAVYDDYLLLLEKNSLAFKRKDKSGRKNLSGYKRVLAHNKGVLLQEESGRSLFLH